MAEYGDRYWKEDSVCLACANIRFEKDGICWNGDPDNTSDMPYCDIGNDDNCMTACGCWDYKKGMDYRNE